MASHGARAAAAKSPTVFAQYHCLTRAVVAALKFAATLMVRHADPTAEDVAFVTDAALLGRERAVLSGVRVDTGRWASCTLGLKVAVGWAGDFYKENIKSIWKSWLTLLSIRIPK